MAANVIEVVAEVAVAEELDRLCPINVLFDEPIVEFELYELIEPSVEEISDVDRTKSELRPSIEFGCCS